jgi:hypothetical protein
MMATPSLSGAIVKSLAVLLPRCSDLAVTKKKMGDSGRWFIESIEDKERSLESSLRHKILKEEKVMMPSNSEVGNGPDSAVPAAPAFALAGSVKTLECLAGLSRPSSPSLPGASGTSTE